MSLKELKNPKPFSGFVAYYDDGTIIKEREDFFSKKLTKKCSTNWAEIDRERLVKLELLWNDESKGFISKIPSENSFNNCTINPQDWFFSQKGYFDLGGKKIIVVARNIGYVNSGILHIFSVVELTGFVQVSHRQAP
jgi:hypothetical protein